MVELSETELKTRLRAELDECYLHAPPPSPQLLGLIEGDGSQSRRQRIHPWLPLAAAAVVATVVAGTALPALLDRGAAPDGQPSATGTSPAPSATSSPSDATAACAPITPRELPDGRPPGTKREVEDGRVAWGAGANQVIQAVGVDELDLLGSADAESVRGGLWNARLMSVGDPGTGVVAFVFQAEGCDYTTWLAAGTSLDLARDFIRRY
jgi:hypothetical protein